jgi:hypothetical protein
MDEMNDQGLAPFPRREALEEQALIDVDVVNHAVEAALPLAGPGHAFSMAWLMSQLGIGEEPEDKDTYKAWQVQYARLAGAFVETMLKTHAIHLEPAPSRKRGFVVIDKAQTPDVAFAKAQRAFNKAIQEASDKIQYAPSDLTVRQRQERADTLARLGAIKLAFEHQRPKPPRPQKQLQRVVVDAESVG